MRGRGRNNLEGIGQELNLIPYLDVMVNLVIFMLVTITSFLSFTILNASIPQIATGPQIPDKLKKAQLLLMVRVTRDGYQVDPSIQGGASLARRALPKVGEQFDFQKLNSVAQELKGKFQDETRVLILAEPKIIYDDIVHTMDALREKEPGAGNLFPDVTLSIL